MTPRPRVGLLGGTFDPIHFGHLAVARAADAAIEFDRVVFIPAARPPHRPDSPRASEYHRVEMVRRAVATEPRWEVCDLELQRSGPSYTIDTLAAFVREGLSPLQLYFMIGADAFLEIATWHRYPDVLDAAHMVVVARPGNSVERLGERVPAVSSRLATPTEARAATRTTVVLVHATTPNVSATDVRRRAASGQPLDELVPTAVAAYISQHQLYRDSRAPHQTPLDTNLHG